MIVEKIDLYEYFGLKRPEGGLGYLISYRVEPYTFHTKRLRPAMLVIAGGGYKAISQREKEPIAFKYLEKGYHAFCLDYSLNPLSHPTQLLEGCMAIAYIRENAAKFNIISDKIGAVGFSAGGHLCGMLATMYADEEVVSALGEKASLCRPNAVILSYAVLSAFGKIHEGSINVLAGDNQELRKKIDLPNRVNENSVPAFIWCTLNDKIVPCENSLIMAQKYRENNVPFALHMFEKGGHGLSTADIETATAGGHIVEEVQAWLPLSFKWLGDRGFIVDNNKGE